MRSLGTVAILLVLLAAPSVAAGLSSQLALSAPGAGWWSARFDVGDATMLEIEIAGSGSGTRHGQIIVLDADGEVLAHVSAATLEMDARVHVRTESLKLERRADVINDGGARSGGTSACDALYGLGIGAESFSALLRLPVPCDGRTPAALVASIAGPSVRSRQLHLAADAPVAIGATLRGDEAVYADETHFSGIGIGASYRAFITPTLGAGYVYASHTIDVEDRWFGVFQGKDLAEPPLSYEHASMTGSCGCTWAGGPPGEWTFHARGAGMAGFYVAGVDARLPP